MAQIVSNKLFGPIRTKKSSAIKMTVLDFSIHTEITDLLSTSINFFYNRAIPYELLAIHTAIKNNGLIINFTFLDYERSL